MTKSLSFDHILIKKLTEIVLANLSDESFSAEKLAKEAGISRASLYRKLKSIKQEDISQFIREVRLNSAMEMLQNNEGTASEIAFRVGFGSPAYFTKCFHDYYGYPPGEVRKRIHPGEGDPYEPTKEGTAESYQLLTAAREAPTSRTKINRKKVIFLSSSIMGVLALALVLLLYVSRHERKDLSIIVLPFKNLSNEPENQYIADGIMEDILNNLFQISELRVISRTTSEHFRVTNLTSGEIAKQVNARNVLEGSIREYNDKLRISVQLIDAEQDHHLWSANFDRELNDILGIQGDIALQVANKLNAKLSDNEIKKIGEIPTRNPGAYEYYLKARFLRYKSEGGSRIDISKEGLISSIQYFEKAVAADENFAEAYAGMAGAWLNLSSWRWLPTNEGFLKARDLSIKALEIDPDCAEAHSVKGSYLVWGERRFEEGRKELLTALQLNPNYPPAYQSYAQLLMITGPIEEARIYIDHALKLEPYYWVLHNLNAWIYYFEDKPEEAIEACRMAKDLKSDYIFTSWLLFLNYAKLGEGMKAAEELQKIAGAATRTNKYDNDIMDAYKRSGVEGLFTWLTEININNPVPAAGLSGQPFFIAWWYAIMGDRGNSIYWLERNMEAKPRLYEYFNLVATNPDFDILRDNPGFLKIIDEIGLSPYNTRKAR
jgi:TolB-like protein/AraC-like DNA-binding protein/Tfp pilus assembly protein PilF